MKHLNTIEKQKEKLEEVKSNTSGGKGTRTRKVQG